MKDVGSNYTKAVLKNGLPVVLYRIDGVRSVFISCHIASGNVNAEKKQLGMAHFLEHLSFCSTEKFPTRHSIFQEQYSIGAYQGAVTTNISTNYWLKCPSIKINNALNLFHQLIFKSTISQKEVITERKIIQNEYRDHIVNENNTFFHKVQENRFISLPSYQERSLGTIRTINSITGKGLRDWKEKFINPQNMVISIVGNFNKEKTIKHLEKTFGSEKKGKKFDFPKLDPSKYSNFNFFQKDRDGEQIQFELTWPAFGWKEVARREEIALAMLNHILGEGPFSKLSLKLREENNIAYFIGSYLRLFPYLGYIGVSGSTHKNDLIKALREIQAVISIIKKYDISELDFQKVQSYFDLQEQLKFETPESIANFLNNQLFEYGNIWTEEKYARERKKIKPGEIKEVANRIFNNKMLNINIFGNVTKDAKEEITKIFLKKELEKE